MKVTYIFIFFEKMEGKQEAGRIDLCYCWESR